MTPQSLLSPATGPIAAASAATRDTSALKLFDYVSYSIEIEDESAVVVVSEEKSRTGEAVFAQHKLASPTTGCVLSVVTDRPVTATVYIEASVRWLFRLPLAARVLQMEEGLWEVGCCEPRGRVGADERLACCVRAESSGWH